MKGTASFLAAAAALVDVAMGHYRFYEFIFNNAITGQYEYVRQNTNDNSPVTDITSTDMRCNVGGLASGPTTSVATVEAGAVVGFEVDLAIYHPGPLAVYMSEVTSGFTIETYDGSGPWFKIYEMTATLNSTAIGFTDVGLDQILFTIPPTTPPGSYLLRIEQLALHVASTVGGAQWYISCAQVVVTGSGGGNPDATFLIPGGYDASDPGILIDIYYPIPTTYTPPGPAVWPSGDTGEVTVGESSPEPSIITSVVTATVASTAVVAPPTTVVTAPTTIVTSVKPTTAPTTVVTSVKPTSTSSTGSSGTAALYGQCGGIGWTGPTACASGSTCQVGNAYYSQCLPA